MERQRKRLAFRLGAAIPSTTARGRAARGLLRLDCANADAMTAAALLTAPREDFFEAYEISTAANRVAQR
jgi:hypothetical protein